MSSKARLAQRTKQVAQCAVPEEVHALIGDFEARFSFTLIAHVPRGRRHARRIVRPVDRDVIFLLHALNQLFNQLLHLVLRHLVKLLLCLLIKIAGFQRLPDRFAQVVHRLVALQLRELGKGILKAGIKQVIRQGLQQVVQFHLRGQVAVVFRIADALHSLPSLVTTHA